LLQIVSSENRQLRKLFITTLPVFLTALAFPANADPFEVSLHQVGGYASKAVTKLPCPENTPCFGTIGVFTETNENLTLQAKAVISQNLLKVSFELNGKELSNGFNTVTAIHIQDTGITYDIISLHVPVLDQNYLPTGRYVDETFAQMEILVRPTNHRKSRANKEKTASFKPAV
jgi:hypothetical protein